jgi:methyl-accepting chemotaxis protein
LNSVRVKLLVAAFLAVVMACIIVGTASYEYGKGKLITAARNDLMDIGENTKRYVESQSAMVEKYGLDKEKVQEDVKETLLSPIKTDKDGKKTRTYTPGVWGYKAHGYTFIYNSDKTDKKLPNVLHVNAVNEGNQVTKSISKRDSSGKDVLGADGKVVMEKIPVPDGNGKDLIRNLVDTALKKDKEDRFYTYPWDTDGKGTIKDKTAYMTYVPEWDWVIGVGAYDEEFYSDINGLKTQIILLTLINIAVSCIIFYLIVRRMVISLTESRKIVERVSSGYLEDVQRTRTSDDDTGKLLRGVWAMVTNLRGIVKKLDSSSDQTRSSSIKLSSNISSMKYSSGNVVKSIEGVTVSILEVRDSSQRMITLGEELSKGIESVAAGCNNITDSIEKVSTAVSSGVTQADNTVSKMESVNTANAELIKEVQTITSRVSMISSSLGVIKDIAEQTNLLSLNASIEAARAGDAGRGFTVVADAIRKLAGQASGSVKDINSVIQTITTDIKSLTMVTARARDEVTSSTDSIHELQQTFHKIAKEVQSVAAEIEDIAAASQEVSAGTHEVVNSMSSTTESVAEVSRQLDNVRNESTSQHNSLEDISRMADDLLEISNQISGIVRQFNTSEVNISEDIEIIAKVS